MIADISTLPTAQARECTSCVSLAMHLGQPKATDECKRVERLKSSGYTFGDLQGGIFCNMRRHRT